MEQAPSTSENNGISADKNNALAEKKREQEKTSADPQWVVEINQKIEQTRGARRWAKLSIYRIPECLRNDDKKSYIPQSVSLGPYYKGKWWLSNMEEHKWRALHQVLTRNRHSVELYIEEAKSMEKDARACYHVPSKLSSKAFVEMLVLDSCFIIELFHGVASKKGFESLGYSPSDPIFTTSFAKRVTVPSIQRDMIMLENQIPLFVLDQIHHIQCPKSVTSVASMALKFFKRLMPVDKAPPSVFDRIQCPGGARLVLGFFKPPVPTDKERPSNRDESTDSNGLHCLDIFRRSLLDLSEEAKDDPVGARGADACPGAHVDQETKKENVPHEGRSQRPTGHDDQEIAPRGPRIHCVTELKEAGVKFEVKETDRFCDIDFNSGRGVLNIPRLLVHHGTKSLFLNLIAFEQYHLDGIKGITSYVTFMDRLIESPADVAHLRNCGIVDSCLGSDVCWGLFYEKRQI